ncbi:MAG TPA: thioredoxin domain-containing protein [Candidatus Bipolaricaulota bacterium]|nr:thioredoxin domain-containing protein [Candidatus Bipolaricaulota bacterium]
MEKNKSNFWMGFFVGLACVSLLCFLGLLIFVFSQGENVNLAEKVQAQDEQDVVSDINPVEQYAAIPPLTADDYVKGDPNAKVVLIEYSDFECPYCLMHSQTMEQIEDFYGNQIAISFRNFPLSFHPEAQKAAEAAECAGVQGKFWEMHDKLFDMNEAGTLGLDNFKAAAKELGLNTTKFNQCLDGGEMAARIAEQASLAQQAGVSGTPATFVNGDLVSGARPLEDFTDQDGNLAPGFQTIIETYLGE